MGRMLDYIDKLGELDTEGVEPMSHVFPVQNVFREDIVTNSDTREQLLANAPEQKDGMFMVPRIASVPPKEPYHALAGRRRQHRLMERQDNK